MLNCTISPYSPIQPPKINLIRQHALLCNSSLHSLASCLALPTEFIPPFGSTCTTKTLHDASNKLYALRHSHINSQIPLVSRTPPSTPMANLLITLIIESLNLPFGLALIQQLKPSCNSPKLSQPSMDCRVYTGHLLPGR